MSSFKLCLFLLQSIKLITCDEKDLASFTSPDTRDSFSDILYASGFPYLEITADNRSLAYECFLQYEVITKRIPALEDIRKGLASVRVKGITLLDLLQTHPNLSAHVFPQCNNIDPRMFRLAMEFDETNVDDEKEAQVFLEKYINDVALRGILSYNLSLDHFFIHLCHTMHVPCGYTSNYFYK